ncbi:hypothetical protein GpartN1_g1173.t1 [Galdieria partita]|uniref:RRM domain-containing protein n=1 Tax=Galdieria partita TaxID=83374 RepID=A0A9C7UNI1_9RHOD|nr:hypothetical protein GpartN1_g1173.t1 [Galdieria partita]
MTDTEEYKPTEENTSQSTKQESEDTVRTLFITGFPADVLEREVHNLFRFRYPLYDGCIIKASSRRKEPVVFAVFRTREEAEEAMKDFDGIVFDPASGSKLKIEFAKSNTRVKRDWAHASSFEDNRRNEGRRVEKRYRGSDYNLGTGASGVVAQLPLFTQPGSWNLATNNTPGLQYPMFSNVSLPLTSSFNQNACSTLFVGNLSPSVTQAELENLFSRCTGFRRVRLNMKDERAPVAFVEFTDSVYSTQAMQQCQNVPLPSSEKGGIRIEFARNKMSNRPSQAEEGNDSPSRTVGNQAATSSNHYSSNSPWANALFHAGLAANQKNYANDDNS